MEFTVKLTDEQFDVLLSLAKFTALPPNELLSDYITLFLTQSEPIHHMVKVIESSKEILPSFIRAVTASKAPEVNLGDMIEMLLGEMFSNDRVFKDLDQVREYFSEKATNPPDEALPPGPPDEALPPGPVDIDAMLKGILKKENKNEDNKA